MISITALVALACSATTNSISTYLVIPKNGIVAEDLVSFGKVVKREKQLYTLQLTQDGLRRLDVSNRTVQIRAASARPNSNSVKDLTRYVQMVKAEAKAAGKSHATGLGGLEGYLWYLDERSFPNDKIDLDAYPIAVKHRDSLPSPARPVTDSSAWSYLGPTNLDVPYRTYWGIEPVNGRISAAAWDPLNAGTLYVGAPMGGVWKSTDSGVNWTPLGDDFSYLPVSSLAVNPLNSDFVYAGTGDFDGGYGYGHGIMMTMDGGATWTETGASDFGTTPVTAIALHPTNPLIVCAATGSRTSPSGGYIWRNTLAGTGVWTKVIPISARWSDLRIGTTDPGGNRVYWAAGVNLTSNYLYRSTNGGLTWTPVGLPPISPQTRLKIAPSKLDYQTLYLLAADAQKVYKTTNSGATWSDITAGFPNGTTDDPDYTWSQYWYNTSIETSIWEDGIVYDSVYVGNVDIARSLDGGATWDSIGGPTWDPGAHTHNDQHAIVAHPQTPNLLLIGNDGGAYMYLYTNFGTTVWNTLNRNLGVTQFYHSDHHPTDPDVMLGGTQDNATPVSTGDLMHWENHVGGDGAGCAVDLTNPGTQYGTANNYSYDATTGYASFTQTQDFWNTSVTTYFPPGSDILPFIGDFKVDRSAPFVTYIGTNYLWRFIYLGFPGSWFTEPRLGLDKLSSTKTIKAIALARTNNLVIYTGSGDGEVWMTEDFGGTWRRIDSGLPVAAVTDIDVHQDDPYDVLVTVSGTGTGHVWHCEDTSTSTPLWLDCSSIGSLTLPDIPVNCIERSMYGAEDTWWVGTDIGVFMTPSEGYAWLNINPLGLPNVQVNDITAVIGNSHMFAATFGRGMWKINIYDPNEEVTSNSTSPSNPPAESSGGGSARVEHPAPDTGTVIRLESDNPAVTVPESCYAWFNSEEASYTFATHFVCSDPVTAHITARLGPSTKVSTMTVLPPTNVIPVNNIVVTEGDLFEGIAPHLRCLDDVVVSILNDSSTLQGSLDMIGTGAPASPSFLGFYWASSVGRPGLSEELTILDRVTGNYTPLAGRLAPLVTTPNKRINIPAPGRYVGLGGALRARLTWKPVNDEDPASDGWFQSVDFAAWRAIP